MTNNYHTSFIDNIELILADIRDNMPLIHCITNPISINDCANAILALGARPIMAEHPKEVSEITGISSALCLNIGNITDARIESIMTSAKTASECNIPFILDVVGITCSKLRFDFLNNLIDNVTPNVIKGNLAEINKLARNNAKFIGIDSTEETSEPEDFKNAIFTVKTLAKELNCIIAASGKNDIISDGTVTACIDNGSKYLPLVTGTGCMLNVIIGTMLASKIPNTFNRTLLGIAIMGICGKIAENKTIIDGKFNGLGTYHINLINSLSLITANDIKKDLEIRFF